MKINFLKMILKSMTMFCLLLMGSCLTLEKGQAIVNENRVFGLDADIPIPSTTSYSLARIRIGWVETKTVIVNDVKVISESNHKDISLIKASGSIERKLTVGE